MEEKTFASFLYIRALVAVALVGLVIALGTFAYAMWEQAQYDVYENTTIDVAGEGEIVAKPDIGQFSFSVRAEANDAAEAQRLSAESVNKIIEYLKESGVEEKDIKTDNYYLNPTYSYEERVCLIEKGYCPPGDSFIDGYEVSQTVTTKVRDLDASGRLISGVGERGATNISSLQFTIDDDATLKAEARKMAIDDAKENAKKLADDLGVDLGRMVYFYENTGDAYPEYGYQNYAKADFGGEYDYDSAPALPTGEEKITSSVNITFEIEN